MCNGHFVQKGFALGIHRYASLKCQWTLFLRDAPTNYTFAHTLPPVQGRLPFSLKLRTRALHEPFYMKSARGSRSERGRFNPNRNPNHKSVGGRHKGFFAACRVRVLPGASTV